MNIIRWKKEFKAKRSCAMCGFNKYPDILHFHHVKKGTRRMDFNGKKIPRTTISQMTSLKRARKEAKKCVLLCPNCHAIHHRKGIKKCFTF